MPASSRKGRGFGGSLLTKPQALPDDDEDDALAPEPVKAVAQASAPQQPIPAPVAPVEKTPEPGVSPARAPKAEVEPVARPALKEAAAKKPPGTLRLNDVAGGQLWDAFLEAKDADPFLSYRKFASDVILDGLAARQRRAKRG